MFGPQARGLRWKRSRSAIAAATRCRTEPLSLSRKCTTEARQRWTCHSNVESRELKCRPTTVRPSPSQLVWSWGMRFIGEKNDESDWARAKDLEAAPVRVFTLGYAVGAGF